jgi:hypothetical protein
MSDLESLTKASTDPQLTPAPWHLAAAGEIRDVHNNLVARAGTPLHGAADAALIAAFDPAVARAFLRVVTAARLNLRHRPVCGFCGGPWNDSHYALWKEQLACACDAGTGGGPRCRIGAALAELEVALAAKP